MAPAGPVRAFLSYAHEDHAWRDALLGHLGWLIDSGQLTVFRDPQIEPGRAMERASSEPSSTAAEIVFVLTSEHFFASPLLHPSASSCRALARQDSGACRPDPDLCGRSISAPHRSAPCSACRRTQRQRPASPRAVG